MSFGTASLRPGHLDYLDGWRGIAISIVLANHFFGILSGRTGVEVFFVLSGLLMSRILFETNIGIGTFYQRRIARILPVFVLYFLFVVIDALVFHPVFPAKALLYTLLMVQAYTPESLQVAWLPITHLWSLNVEEHSYVFLSLVALCTRKRRTVLTVLTIAALACCAMYLVYAQLGINGTRRTECAAFAVLASAVLRLALRDTRHARSWLAFGTMALVGSMLANRLAGGSPLLEYAAKPLCMALMVNTLHAAPALILKGLSMRWLRWLGLASFSLYVWQQPFYYRIVLEHLSPLVGLAAALAIAALSFYAFETPMRRALRNLRLPVGWATFGRAANV